MYARFCTIFFALSLCSQALCSQAFAALSEQSPSREVLVFWRFAAVPTAGVPAPWAEQLVANAALSAVRLTDDDPTSLALAQCSIALALRGHAQTGAIFRSTPEGLAEAITTAAEEEAAAIARLEAFKAKLEADRKAREAAAAESRNPASGAQPPDVAPPATPTPTALAPTAPSAPPPAATDAATPAEAPAPPGRKRAKSIVVEIAGRGKAEELREAVGSALGKPLEPTDPPFATIAELPISSVSMDGWSRPLLWTQTGDRLLLATDQRALELALSPTEEDVQDPIRLDWIGQRRAVIAAQPDAQRLAMVMLNVNALRHEAPYAFAIGNAARTLNVWRLSNVRTLAVHLATRNITLADRSVPLVVADLSWTARSQPPGEAARASLTVGTLASTEKGMLIPNADALLVFPANYRAAMDWVVQTHFASLGEDIQRQVDDADYYRGWLTDHRARVSRIIETLGTSGVLGIVGWNDPDSKPVLPWRFTTRGGAPAEQLTEDLERALAIANVQSTRSETEPLNPLKTVWSIPFSSRWLSATAAWGACDVHGAQLLVGGIVLDDQAVAPVVAVQALMDATTPNAPKAPSASTTQPIPTPEPEPSDRP